MPFVPLNHDALPASYTNVYRAVSMRFSDMEPYDLTLDPQRYVDDIKKVFEMKPLDDATISQILGSGISQFSLSDIMRSPEDQEKYRSLNEQARDCFANEMVRYERTYAELEAAVGREAAKGLGRLKPYLRHGGTEEDLAFNKEFLAACSKEDTLAQAQFKEVMKSFKDFGINSPKDFANLYELSNEDFLKNYAQIARVARMVSELQHFKDTPYLTEDQRAEITPYLSMGIGYTMIMEHRLNLMASPLYSTFDPERLYEKVPNTFNIQDTMESLDNEGAVKFGKESAYHHPLGVFCASIKQLSDMNSDTVMDRAPLLYPELKGAAFSTDVPSPELQSFRPVVAHTRDGQALVLTNSLHLKPQTVREYSKNLTEEAIQADKWLLTGSKQFADMMKLSKEFDELQSSASKTITSQLDKAKELVKAASDYLEYKGLNLENIDFNTLLHRGKNQREQSRLEVALKILQFAKAEGASLEKVPEMEAAMAAEAKAERPAKIRASLTTVAGKNDIPNLVSDLLSRAGPKKEVDGKTVDILPKQDLSALYALACGSDKVYYKRAGSKLDDNGKQIITTHTNEKPEETFNAMLQGVCSGQSGSDVTQNKMMTAAMSRVFHCLNSKNYDELGQLLADGLKMNHKVMQNQKGFTPEFFVCAKLGEQVLDVMAKNPEIKAAVEKYATKEDLQANKAGAAISELHSKGLQAFGRLYNRFQLEDKEAAFKGIEEDLSNLCQMRGVAKQLAGNKLDLANDNYGKIANYSSHLNKALAGNEPMTGFIKDLAAKSPKDQLADIRDPKKMATLYEDGIGNVMGIAKQQNQLKQPELKLNVVQHQPQPEPVPAPQVLGGMG